MNLLDDIIARVGAMQDDAQVQVLSEAHAHTAAMKFVPNPGPQTDAYLSQADVLLYGGQAGGGKTYLELGWGINVADSGIIFRREASQTDGLQKEGKALIGADARFNGSDLEWTWPNGKTLKLAGMKEPGDWLKHAGRERDYFAFDEAGEFLEMQVASILAWLRAAPGKRTRVILGSNPPRTSEGLWLLKWFAPWIDPKHPDRAAPGELRWAVHVTRGDTMDVIWVGGPGEYTIDGETYGAKSYTFIPASLADNPTRNTPEYRRQLQSLPEPLRSQLLYGKFTAGLEDSANQLIPTAWVIAAQERWTPEPPKGVPMCMIGVDCSGGGNDPMIVAPRYDGWYAPLIEILGRDIPQDRAGAYCAGVIASYRRDKCPVTVDMGGGYGGPTYEVLRSNDVPVHRYKGAEATTRRSRDGGMKFVNVRSAALWLFREALDPGQPGGSPIALPPDQRLLADLTAPMYDQPPRGIEAEDKKAVMKRIGRSTDRGDAVVMGWFFGERKETAAMEWMDLTPGRWGMQKTPQVISGGREPLTAKRRT